MPSQRAVLEMLTRSDLLTLVTHHKLEVEDRRVRDHLVAALNRISFEEALTPLSAASLKFLVAECALTPASKKKDALIAALVAAAPSRKAAKKSAPKGRLEAPQKSAKKKISKKAVAAKETVSKPKPAARAAKKSINVSKKVKGSEAGEPTKKAVAKSASVAKKDAEPIPKNTKKKDVAKTEGRKKKTRNSVAAPSPEKETSSKEVDADVAATPPPKRPGQISSWAEVALAAAARGQSAESMLKPVGPARHVHTNARKCASCGEKLSLRKCSVQACSHMLLAESRQKICAECRFERNTLSMTDFEEVLAEERACPHCEKNWRKGS